MTAGAARFAVLRVDGAPSWYESAAYAKVAAMFCALSEIAHERTGRGAKTADGRLIEKMTNSQKITVITVESSRRSGRPRDRPPATIALRPLPTLHLLALSRLRCPSRATV